MPYKSIKDADKAGFNTELNDIPLTLGQVNLIAEAYDSIKEKADVESPMGVAVASFKKSHKIEDGKWVKKETLSIDLSGNKNVFDVDNLEVFMAGKWHGKDWTEKHIDNMIHAFNNVAKNIPVKLGHAKEQKLLQEDGYPAAGYIRSLSKKFKEIAGKQIPVMVASLRDVPKKIKEIIDNKGYAARSCEVYTNFNDNGAIYPTFMGALALLGGDIPAVSNLDDFRDLYSASNYVNKDSITFAYDSESGTLTELNFKEEEEKRMDELKKLQEENEKLKADAIKLNESVTKLTADAKTKADADVKLAAENKKKEIVSFIDSMVAKGKVLPANKDMTVATMLAIDESQKISLSVDGKVQEISALEAFKKSIESMPDLVKFSEKTKTGDKVDQFSEEELKKTDKELGIESEQTLHKFALKIQTEQKVIVDGKEVFMSYEDALIAASKQHPELSKKW